MGNGQQGHQSVPGSSEEVFRPECKAKNLPDWRTCVFVYMPAAKTGPAYKLARPYHGPYHITATHDTGLEVTPVDRPQDTPIRVAFNRVRACPEEIGNDFYPRNRHTKETQQDDPLIEAEDETNRVWTGRLRSIPSRGRLQAQAGEM